MYVTDTDNEAVRIAVGLRLGVDLALLITVHGKTAVGTMASLAVRHSEG